jgi:putative methyltransferase (TIGR04325 family)
MKSSIRHILKLLLPPIVTNARRRFFATHNSESVKFTGDFTSWAKAEQSSTGYSIPSIVAKTRASMLKVKNGEAAFERDSVLFYEMEHSFPLLAGLLHASVNHEYLSVLDFGGALGSTYFQCRGFLSIVKDLRWSIVEQPAHVVCGRAEFTNEQLHFYETIDDCLRAEQPNVLLLSSVIQYLPRPYEFLADVLTHEFDYVIIDRTPFLRSGRDRLTIEQVPAWIYEASYPSWFLSEKRFLERFQRRYDLVASFPALDRLHPEGEAADYKGFIFRLKQQA